jgi:hypothetical protein
LMSIFGKDHALLMLAGLELQSQDIFQEIDLFVRHRYNDLVHSYLVLSKQVEPVRVEANVLLDFKGELAERYGNTPAFYLVRPDGYVAFRSLATEARLLRGYLSKLCTGGAPGTN